MNSFEANSLKSMRWTLFTTGGLLVLLGVLSLFYSNASLLSLAFFVGIGFIIAGLNHLIPYFSLRGDALRPKWFLPQGIVDVLVGVVLLMNIGLTALMVPILLGMWMIFVGLMRFAGSFYVKRAGVRKWWIMLLSGLLLLSCGFSVLCSPVISGGMFVSMLIASMFFASGFLIMAEGKLIYAPQ